MREDLEFVEEVDGLDVGLIFLFVGDGVVGGDVHEVPGDAGDDEEAWLVGFDADGDGVRGGPGEAELDGLGLGDGGLVVGGGAGVELEEVVALFGVELVVDLEVGDLAGHLKGAVHDDAQVEVVPGVDASAEVLDLVEEVVLHEARRLVPALHLLLDVLGVHRLDQLLLAPPFAAEGAPLLLLLRALGGHLHGRQLGHERVVEDLQHVVVRHDVHHPLDGRLVEH